MNSDERSHGGVGGIEPIPDEYLSQVAHEMRGSLNTILGWAEYLRSSAGDEAARLRAAETIIRHARQQTWMVSELVDTCRLAGGTLVLAETAILLDDLVRSAADAVAPMADAKSVSVHRVDAPPDVRSRARLRGDARRLAQALTTLLSNAVQFSEPGRSVDVTTGMAGAFATIEIRDDGLGLSPEALRHLFDRGRSSLTDGGSPRRDFRTGLALARDVIGRHGGSLTASSTDPSGVTFTVRLPVANGAVKVVKHEESALPPDPIRGVRVLLVDDEPDARDALVGILTHYGASVRAAGSAADAVAMLGREPMDVLLADIGMPGEDGYDLIRSVRSLTSGAAVIPAVAVTAFTSDFDRRRALEAGYQVHLSKPIDPSTLVATVARLGRARTSVR